MDSAYPTIPLLCDCVDLNVHVIATQWGRTAHLPANINSYKQICKDRITGYSDCSPRINQPNFLEWFKCLVLIDNDFLAGEDNWDLIGIRSSGGNVLLMLSCCSSMVRIIILTERLSKNRTEFLKMLLKHMWPSMLIQFLSASPISLRKRAKLIWKNDQFHFEIVRVWFAKCRAMNGGSSTHYPLCQPLRCRKLQAFIHSLTKGPHVQAKIDDFNSKKHIPCHECSKWQSYLQMFKM